MSESGAAFQWSHFRIGKQPTETIAYFRVSGIQTARAKSLGLAVGIRALSDRRLLVTETWLRIDKVAVSTLGFSVPHWISPAKLSQIEH